MPFTVTMPKLSPTMEEGAIAKWHVKEGQHVDAGQLLIEVSTDKATVEYNALDGGWLRKILIPEGQSASVNQAIAIFTEEKTESINGYQPTGIQPAAKAAEAPTAAAVKEKAQAVSTQPAAAIKQAAFVPEPPLEGYHFAKPSEKIQQTAVASPLAKKLAKEKGFDLSTIKGTGPGHRIVSRDLEQAQSAGLAAFSSADLPQHAPGSYEEEPLTPIRKTIGQRLQDSKTFIPHFYVKQEINAEPLVSVREQLINLGSKVTINDLMIRACALVLRAHPALNSGFNSVSQTIIRFKTIDISMAVSLETGLITPIIRHADFKNLGEISLESRHLSKLAREGKLSPADYKGGSFTISNLGMYGITDFQAIINPPQAAILAVSTIRDEPVVKNGAVVPGKVMSLTLSVDHRVIDGVAAAEFLKTLKKMLENPVGLVF